MHTVCIHMRLLVDGFLRDTKSMGSPGVEEVRYLAPVRAGDSLSLRLEVTNLRAVGEPPRHRLPAVPQRDPQSVRHAGDAHDLDADVRAARRREGTAS